MCGDSVIIICSYIKEKMTSSEADALWEALKHNECTLFQNGDDFMSIPFRDIGPNVFSFCIVLPGEYLYKTYKRGEKYSDKDIDTGIEWADKRIKQYLMIAGMYKEQKNE